MYRSINCCCFKRKFINKFLIFCCLFSFIITVLIFYPSAEELRLNKIESNKNVLSQSKLRIIETLQDEVYLIKSPVNVFGNHAIVGESGSAVVLPKNISDNIKKLVDQGFKDHSFNQYVSDIISVNRTLKDGRTDYCKRKSKSYTNLPKTSVIVTFHNEAWSTLLRTINSILNRSPEELIVEIILVDDFSNMIHLKNSLDYYVKKFPKIKIIRCKERKGLIKARIIGALAAKGQTLTFLDSHIECTPGWLEPLLDRIAKDPKNVAVPVIDIIDDKTLAYEWLDAEVTPIGGFDWKLEFKWIMDIEMRENPSLPLKTPTMAGGLFTIDKAFFEHLGLYDPDFDIWGGENLELSFKTWMCGGTLEIVPCSHVGHIFRSKSPYVWRPGVNVLHKNLMRMSQVWMDDYAKFYFMRIHVNKDELPDVSERKILRDNLKCHDFRWYLENIYPSQIDPSKAHAQGIVRNKIVKKCIEILPSKAILEKCHKGRSNQFLILSGNNEIRRDNFCLYHSEGKVKCAYCNAQSKLKSDHLWIYLNYTNQIYHNNTRKCLTVGNKNILKLSDCDSTAVRQRWFFEYVKNIHY